MPHSLLLWTLATVKQEHDGSGALRNLPVTTMPSTAHVAYLSLQGMKSGTHEELGSKVSLFEEHCAAVLGNHVEVLRKRLVVAKAPTFLHTGHMQRAIEMTGQQTRVRTSCGSGIPRKQLWSV